MKPSARIQASLEILERATQSRIPLDGVVGDYMRSRRYIGAKDRANVAERVYNMTRATARLRWWLEKSNMEDIPRNRMIAWLSLCEKYDPVEYFDGQKFAPPKLDKDEARWSDYLKKHRGEQRCALEHPDMALDVKCECPPQYADSLRAYFGDDFEAEMKALIESATLDLRVNTGKAGIKEVQEFLKKNDIESAPTPIAKDGLRLAEKVHLAKTKIFAKGWVDIQDEGSQLIAECCDAQPGMQVLDYCAGAGGKTLAIAAAMKNKGRIVAMDTEEGRLAKARPRLRKAGVHDIIEVRPLSVEKNRKWLRRQKGAFDLVLLDVPCTGTGTWRRNPDMRWRTYGPSLEELVQTQAEILERTCGVVKEGGKLVYATCSLLPEENEKQIEAFLKAHPEFEVIAPPEHIPAQNKFMRLTPHRHNTDGFFAAVMQKKS